MNQTDTSRFRPGARCWCRNRGISRMDSEPENIRIGRTVAVVLKPLSGIRWSVFVDASLRHRQRQRHASHLPSPTRSSPSFSSLEHCCWPDQCCLPSSVCSAGTPGRALSSDQQRSEL